MLRKIKLLGQQSKGYEPFASKAKNDWVSFHCRELNSVAKEGTKRF